MNDDIPMFWYTHEDERVRMLRYSSRQMLPPEVRLTADYPDDPKIGVVISTFGSLPFLDLNLHYLVNVNHLRVLIHDDCSPFTEELIELCKRYTPNVQLYTTKQRLWHKTKIGTLGDTHSFLIGLEWAVKNNIDILVKLSRRMVCTSEFTEKLKALALESEAFTFGSFCQRDDFPLRTECMAMCVKAWSHNFPISRLALFIQKQFPIFAEFWFHDMARVLAYANGSKKYREFIDKQNLGLLYEGYAYWRDLMGITRYDTTPNALWHSANPIEDYVKAAEKVFGNRYTKEDFERLEEF